MGISPSLRAGTICWIASLVAACGSPAPAGNQAAAAAPPPAASVAPASPPPAPPPLLEHCDRPLGSLSVVEDEKAAWGAGLRAAKLGPTQPLLRMLVQLSNCFVVADTGGGSKARPAADFGLSPSIKTPTGAKRDVGSAALALVDNRSAVPVAAADGNAATLDADALASLLGGSVGATAGGYTVTPVGRAWAAGFGDAYNQIVRAARGYVPKGVDAAKPAPAASARKPAAAPAKPAASAP